MKKTKHKKCIKVLLLCKASIFKIKMNIIQEIATFCTHYKKWINESSCAWFLFADRCVYISVLSNLCISSSLFISLSDPLPLRCTVASLLTLALHGDLVYLTEVMEDLLQSLMDQSSNANPKLLLRRTESIVEKLLTNWMSICLYGFLRVCPYIHSVGDLESTYSLQILMTVYVSSIGISRTASLPVGVSSDSANLERAGGFGDRESSVHS